MSPRRKAEKDGEDTLKLYPVNPSANDWETGIPALSQKVKKSDISAHRKIWAESSFLSFSYHISCTLSHPQA